MLRATTTDAFKFTMRAEEALTRASINGIRLNMEYAQQQAKELAQQCKDLETKFFEESNLGQKWTSLFGYNRDINARAQIIKALKAIGFDKFRITEKGNESADKKVLEKLDYDDSKYLLKRNKLNTILTNTILPSIRAVDQHGFVHPFFKMYTAKTYRGSCNDPNIQSQAKHDEEQKRIVRGAFFARDDHHQLIEIDLKANEVSVGLSLHRDPTMMRFLSVKGADMHNEATIHNFMLSPGQLTDDLRGANKGTFVFPQFYGAGVESVARGFWELITERNFILGDGTPLKEHMANKQITCFDDILLHAKKEISWFWDDLFSEYGQWKERCWETYQKQGYLDYPDGFRVTNKMSKTQAINCIIQGTAFHFMIAILIGLQKRMDYYKCKSLIVGEIHDSILVDAIPEEIPLICNLYLDSQAAVRKKWDFIVYPIVAEMDKGVIGGSWSTLKKAGALEYANVNGYKGEK